ncbi:MAG: hypothetical protein WCI41_00625 [bacterium]
MENYKNPIESKILFLKQKLEKFGVDFSKWGTMSSKTIEQLQKEIDKNEISLEEENGEIFRVFSLVAGDVYYVSPTGEKLKLREEKQIFNDGRERRRVYNEAVNEKMVFGESPQKAMLRGIKEELGIDDDLILSEINNEENVNESQSYPGIKSKKTIYKFEIFLNDKQFKKEGYVEKQSDKNTYFIWDKVR